MLRRRNVLMGTHRQRPLRMANTLHTVNKQGFLQSSVLTESASGFTCHICPLERRAALQGNVLQDIRNASLPLIGREAERTSDTRPPCSPYSLIIQPMHAGITPAPLLFPHMQKGRQGLPLPRGSDEEPLRLTQCLLIDGAIRAGEQLGGGEVAIFKQLEGGVKRAFGTLAVQCGKLGSLLSAEIGQQPEISLVKITEWEQKGSPDALQPAPAQNFAPAQRGERKPALPLAVQRSAGHRGVFRHAPGEPPQLGTHSAQGVPPFAGQRVHRADHRVFRAERLDRQPCQQQRRRPFIQGEARALWDLSVSI